MKLTAAAVLALLAQNANGFSLRQSTRMALKPGATVTVLGPGNKQVQLIAAKIASRAGYKTSLLIADGEQPGARTLLYGRDYSARGVDESGNVQLFSGAEGLGQALKKSDGVIIVSDYKEVPQKLIESTMVAAPQLKRMALLSEHGGPKEETFKQAAADAGVEWTVARAGLLKGGGPGNVDRGDDYGLDVYFYDNNPDIQSFQKDKFSDQYLQGAKITQGDVVSVGPLQKIMANNAMSTSAVGSANRCTVAGALVQALGQDACTNSEFGVDSIRGLAPPPQRSWDEAFATMAATGEAETVYQEGEQPAVERQSKAAKWRDEAKERAGLETSDLAPIKYKLGASTREEETLRKQWIGHVIPGAFAAAAVFKGVTVFTFFDQ